MQLSDFIKKRLAELGKNRSWLINSGDLDWSTLSNIDKGMTIRKVTQEKLARALQCSMGDIQQCLMEQNPLKDVVVSKKALAKMKPSVMETVDKLEAMIKEEPYVTPEPEPAEVFQADEPEVEPVDMMFPVETEVETDNRITREVAEECYKRKLKDKVGKILTNSTHALTDSVKQEIGVMLLQELWGESE